MNKIFTFVMLSSISILSADHYGSGYSSGYNYDCPSCNTGRTNYQERSNYYSDGQYRDGSYRDGQHGDGYYQRDSQYGDSTYQGNVRYDRNDQGNQYNQRNDNIRHDGQMMRQDGRSNDDNRQVIRQDGRSYDDNRNVNNSNSKMVNDQDVAKNIRDALTTGWFTKGYEGVTYEVANGNVILRGSVDSVEKKNKAEEIVRKIDGVKQVDNQIVVGDVNLKNANRNDSSYKNDNAYKNDNNYRNNNSNGNSYSEDQLKKSEIRFTKDTAVTAQDRQINAKVRDKLSNGWFSKGYEAIVVETSNGVVVISGTVDKFDDVQKINDELKSVDGVRRVDNRVSVKKQ